MPVNSKLLEVLPDDYGYVILVAVAHNLHNFYLSRNVMKARKEFGVEVRFVCPGAAFEVASHEKPRLAIADCGTHSRDL